MNPSVVTWNKIAERSYAARVVFLETELDIAMTLASVALWWATRSRLRWSANQQSRNEHLARTAYESAVRFLANTGLSPNDADQLTARREQVESVLQQLTRTAE